MRQFFSWRIWLALGSVVGLVVLLRVMLPADAGDKPSSADVTDSTVDNATGSATDSAIDDKTDRTVDFVSFVFQVQPGNRFFVRDGVVNGSADVIIDGQRTMRLLEGIPGELDCPEFREIGKCVVVADLLGDAVIWFALVPVQPGLKVQAAPIVEVMADGVMRLESGWLVRSASSIDRRCDTETGSLSEFIRDFGPESTTIIDVETQEITAVVCATADPDESTTTSSPASTSTAAVSTTIEVDTIPEEG